MRPSDVRLPSATEGEVTAGREGGGRSVMKEVVVVVVVVGWGYKVYLNINAPTSAPEA